MHKRTIFTKEELSQMLEGKEVVYQDEKMERIYCMEKETVKKPGEKKLILVNMCHSYYVRDSLRNNNIPFFQCTTNSLTRIETEKCAIQFTRDDMKYVRGYRPDAAFCFSSGVKEYLLTPNVIMSDYITDLVAYVISIENGTAEKELAKSFELMKRGLLSIKEFVELYPEFADSHNDVISIISKQKVESEKPTPLTKKEFKDLLSGKKTPNQIRAEHGLSPVEELQNLILEWEKEFVKKPSTELTLTDNHGKVLKRGNAAVLAEVIHISQNVGCIPTMKYSERNKYMELVFEWYFNNFTLCIKEE